MLQDRATSACGTFCAVPPVNGQPHASGPTTMPRQLLLPTLLLGCLCACHFGRPTIGYIPTAPVSIPTDDPAFGALLVDVSAVTDSMDYGPYRVRSVQRTAEQALSAAFRSTFPVIGTASSGSFDHTLQLLLFQADLVPVAQQVHTVHTVGQRSVGPTFSSSTTQQTLQVVEIRYKALLRQPGSSPHILEGTLTTPATRTPEEDLREAVERVAEDLNSKVVRSIAGWSAE